MGWNSFRKDGFAIKVGFQEVNVEHWMDLSRGRKVKFICSGRDDPSHPVGSFESLQQLGCTDHSAAEILSGQPDFVSHIKGKVASVLVGPILLS
jgi:hypothetical protein